ncbi:MAG: lipoprotein insertase outer membrane protein LolB [Sideroxydans sp.]|jgi:outer membrane lipoprotein LolB
MRAAVLSLLLLLAACTTTPVLVQRATGVDAPFAFNGRIAIRQALRRDNASVRWMHRDGTDEILFLAPLGQTVARITRNAQRVMLETDGKQYIADDAETLMQQVMGWHLPLSGLRHWVTGMPQPGAPYERELDANGQVSVLQQEGWTIRYSRYAAPGAEALPLRLSLQREGVEVRLVIDEWEVQ